MDDAESNVKIDSRDLSSKKITFTWENIDVYLPEKKQNGFNKLNCFSKEIQKTHIIQYGLFSTIVTYIRVKLNKFLNL